MNDDGAKFEVEQVDSVSAPPRARVDEPKRPPPSWDASATTLRASFRSNRRRWPMANPEGKSMTA